MDFYIEIPEDIYKEVQNFNESLGMWFWNIAVMTAPYDTGNLRRAITLKKNTNKHIQIAYDTMKANYLHFLEEGIGPVKKHKGFIKDKTRLAITEQMIIYLKTGRKPIFTPVPYVALRSSSNLFPRERSLLRSAGMNHKVISANERMKISQIYESYYRTANKESLRSGGGKKVQTSKGGYSRKGFNSLVSELYNEARKPI